MANKRITEIGYNKNKLEGETLQPTLNDLIYKRTPFLKLTKDDFEVVKNESEVTPMEVNNNKTYFYELTPKLDWINGEIGFEKLGYNLKVKLAEGEDIFNEIQSPLHDDMQNNIIFAYDGSSTLGFINNGKYDYKNQQLIEKNCFFIKLRNVPNTVIDFELELFKIDAPPTLLSHDDLAYYLVIDKDGRLCKYYLEPS